MISASDNAPVSAAASASVSTAPQLFVDDEWTKELEDIEVEEVDGEWKKVTMFRNKVRPNHVCLWFGGDEHEGIDPHKPCTHDSRIECLEDDEGFDINWRTIIGVDQSDSESSDDDDE